MYWGDADAIDVAGIEDGGVDDNVLELIDEDAVECKIIYIYMSFIFFFNLRS